jgi:predicted nucleic acid-binding protein
MLTNEVKTEAVQQWLMDRLDQDLAISDWTSTEFSSALSIKLRRREIGEETKSWALSYFGFHKEQSFSVFSVSRQAFQKASLFAGRPSLNLRGSDALHLAICEEFNAGMLTLDRRMHNAALALGLTSELI